MTLVIDTVPNVFIKPQRLKKTWQAFPSEKAQRGRGGRGEKDREVFWHLFLTMNLALLSLASTATNRYTHINTSCPDSWQCSHVWHYWIISHLISLEISFSAHAEAQQEEMYMYCNTGGGKALSHDHQCFKNKTKISSSFVFGTVLVKTWLCSNNKNINMVIFIGC